MFEKKVSLFPFWLPQMNMDIRKPTSMPNLHPGEEFEEERRQPFKTRLEESFNTGLEKSLHNKPDQHVIDMNILANSPLAEATSSSDALLGSTRASPSRRRASMALQFKNWMKRRRFTWQTGNLSGQHFSGNSLASSNNKRIMIPVRVEPKVFFANERTFLSWLHFSIFLGGISTALLGLGATAAKISGYLFATISGLFAVYALWLYHWRAKKIRNRDPGPYDDLFGPTILAIVFITAMIINVALIV